MHAKDSAQSGGSVGVSRLHESATVASEVGRCDRQHEATGGSSGRATTPHEYAAEYAPESDGSKMRIVARANGRG